MMSICRRKICRNFTIFVRLYASCERLSTRRRKKSRRLSALLRSHIRRTSRAKLSPLSKISCVFASFSTSLPTSFSACRTGIIRTGFGAADFRLNRVIRLANTGQVLAAATSLLSQKSAGAELLAPQSKRFSDDVARAERRQ